MNYFHLKTRWLVEWLSFWRVFCWPLQLEWVLVKCKIPKPEQLSISSHAFTFENPVGNSYSNYISQFSDFGVFNYKIKFASHQLAQFSQIVNSWCIKLCNVNCILCIKFKMILFWCCTYELSWLFKLPELAICPCLSLFFFQF